MRKLLTTFWFSLIVAHGFAQCPAITREMLENLMVLGPKKIEKQLVALGFVEEEVTISGIMASYRTCPMMIDDSLKLGKSIDVFSGSPHGGVSYSTWDRADYDAIRGSIESDSTFVLYQSLGDFMTEYRSSRCIVHFTDADVWWIVQFLPARTED